MSQAEPAGLHIELMGLQVSVMGLDTMGLTTELIVEAMADTELGTCMNGQGLWDSGVAIVLVMGQSVMLCWSSRCTQYSNMELGLAWEKQKGRKMMKSRSETRNIL